MTVELDLASSSQPKTAQKWPQDRKEWPALLRELNKPGTVKDCGGYVLGVLRNGRRDRASVVSRSAVTLDADTARADLLDVIGERLPGTLAAAHPTYSDAPGARRFRVIVPLDRPATAAEYPNVARWLMDRLGPDQFDAGSVEPERFMFWPATQDRDAYRVTDWSGEPLGVDRVLAEVALDAALRESPEFGGPTTDAGSPEPVRPPEVAVPDGYVRAAVAGALRDLDELADLPLGVPNARGHGWDTGVLAAACQLRRAANSGTGYTLDQAEADFIEHTPTDAHFGARRVAYKWDQAGKKVGGAALAPHGNPADDFGPLPVTEPPAPAKRASRPRMVQGGSFILDLPDHVPALWGTGNGVAWAKGEALTLAGPPGVGKTTVAGQVVRARLVGGTVLGMRVEPTSSRVLYLAMDRPQQIARALRRTLRDVPRDVLNARLVVWQGPPEADVATHTNLLLELAREAGADTIVVDSLKDAALGLSEDAVGAGYNRARQACLADGVEVLELHHMVKKGDNGGKPTSLSHLYGSAWIAAGSGSVILLWGQPGDPVVEWKHLKQPAEEIGPFKVIHDHESGTSTVFEAADLLALATASAAEGLTAKAAAQQLFSTTSPTDSEVQKARRKLDALVKLGSLVNIAGDAASKRPTVWVTPAIADLGAGR